MKKVKAESKPGKSIVASSTSMYYVNREVAILLLNYVNREVAILLLQQVEVVLLVQAVQVVTQISYLVIIRKTPVNL